MDAMMTAEPRAKVEPVRAAAPIERSDEDLFAAYQRGEVPAFHTLVKRHEKPLYRFCFRSLGNVDAAVDAVQEVFLRIVKNAPRWEAKAKFTTWLYTVARNYCIDEARKKNFRKTDSLNERIGKGDGDGTERIDTLADDAPDAGRVKDGKRIRATIDACLAKLPPEQREVFCMRQYTGLAFKEIADATGAGENTVKSRMRYALAALQDALKAAGFEGPDSS
jgi:RNA polymerase sigma-70 factor (ECF subfamily)